MMETVSAIPGLRKDLSAVIKQGLTLLLMLIVSGLAGHLPGADFVLGDRIPIVLLLRFAIALGMVWVLLLIYRQTSRLLRQGVVTILLRGHSPRQIEASATKVANNTTLLIYVCLLCGVFMRGFEPLITALTAVRWPFTVVLLCSLVLAVVAIIGILVGASPLFGHAGDMLADRVTAPAQPLQGPRKCPGCGVLDDGGSRHCRFCGRMLAEESATTAIPASTTCTRCGGTLNQPARFCPACGKPV